MAITDPQVVKFSNEEVRTVADKAVAYYWQAKAFVTEWDAQGLGALIPNSAAEIVVDGSAEDGRGPITGQDIHNLYTQLTTMITDLENNSNLKLNVLSKIEVNGSPN